MKNITYIIFSIFILISCYEDKGNYDYKDINEVNIEGIDKSYDIDVDDTLKISPIVKGTIYSDTSKFAYAWEIGRRIVSTNLDLAYVGERVMQSTCRFIAKDKDTKVEESFIFDLNVNSSTAADAILVLSNYKGNAELSYLRIDKDDATFVPNYYFDKNEEYLGTNPKSISRNYCTYLWQFPGLQVLVDEGIKNIDAITLNKYKNKEYIDSSFYFKFVPPYPKPKFKDFNPTFIKNVIDQYRKTPYGSIMKTTYLDVIAGGRYFGGSFSWNQYNVTIGQESPLKGELSPYCFSVYQKPKILDLSRLPNVDIGYYVSSFTMMFDKTHGKFVCFDRGRYIYEIEEFNEYDYKGFDLTYGSHTSEYNNCYAVLTRNDVSKLIMIKAPGNSSEKRPKQGTPADPTKIVDFEILGDIDISKSLINNKTKFYTENYGNYMYFSTGNSFYKYNFKNIALNIPPTPSNKVFDLTKYGYDQNAKITAMFISRTEKSIILGVSRYGSDTNGESDELKGDLLIIDNTNTEYNLVKKHVGISGYPVDVIIKYKEFYRDGKDFNYVLKDKY